MVDSLSHYESIGVLLNGDNLGLVLGNQSIGTVALLDGKMRRYLKLRLVAVLFLRLINLWWKTFRVSIPHYIPGS